MSIRRRSVFERIHELDLALFRRTARWHAPVGDRVLPRLSRAADKSLLWSATAAVLFATRTRWGRRAGFRGLFALVVGSIVGNLQAVVFRRRRPDLTEVPSVRRLRRLPVSPSFPSRHATSAFAFAVGATLEQPRLGPPLVGTAAAVAFSRVYTGVHYPSDAIAGAVLGTGVALATRHLWPVPPDEPARGRPASVSLDERSEPDGSGLTIVVNPDAGGAGGTGPDDLREAFPGADVVETSEHLTLEDALGKAAAGDTAIGICGGDGSVNAAAKVAHQHGKPLVIVPGGTLNHFAHDAGLDSLDDAVAAVEKGQAAGVDVGEIAGRPFLNTASFGSYVDLVDERERVEDRIGKWPAMAVALFRVLRRSEPVRVEIDGRPVRAWLVFIGNCRYHPSGFTPSWRSRLDDGTFDVRYVDASARFARSRVLWALLTGTLDRTSAYRRSSVESMHVRSSDGPLRLACDGETFSAPAEFTVRKSDERLVVFVPERDEEEVTPDGASGQR